MPGNGAKETRSVSDHQSRPQQSLPRPFQLERYFARYEFTAAHQLCQSDCEPLAMRDVLAMADEDCKKRWANMTLGYTEPDGDPALRQAIAELYKTVTADNIVVMVPQEAIAIAARAVLEPGDNVVCMRPAYQSLYEHAVNMGCSLNYWDCQPDALGRLYFDVAKLEQCVTANTKAVFVNFPHNPTGCLISHEDWRTVISLCSEVGAYLFSDEMYRQLELTPAACLPSAVDCYDKAITLSGMSKAYGMAGIRLGWLATKCEASRTVFQQLHDYSSICHVGPAEVLALIGLRNGRQILDRNLELIRSNLQLAHRFFHKYSGIFEFQAPDSSSICYPRLTTGQPIEQFCDRLVKDSGVLLLPSTMYENPELVTRGHFRLGLGRKSFAACLQKFDEYLAVRTKGDVSPPIGQI